MRAIAFVGVLAVAACAKGREVAPTPVAPGPVGAPNEIALARYPDTEAKASLACEELCGKPDRVPECPGGKRVGQGAIAVTGLAGKVAVATVGEKKVEAREDGGVKVWDALPAGTVGVAAGDVAFACLAVRPGERIEYDAAKLTNVLPEAPDCRGGTGVMDGNMAEFEYIAEPFPRALVIGANGCRRKIEVSSYGTFKVEGLPAGLYLVRSNLDEFGVEVHVNDGETVKVDLQPLEAEYTRREERRRECGCPTDYKKR